MTTFLPPVTLPHFPYPPETILYPGHAIVEAYHHSIVSHWNLSSYIRLNHEVVEAKWIGDGEEGEWKLRVRDRSADEKEGEEKAFDHLIVASGHNHFPYEPKFEGSELWLAAGDEKKEGNGRRIVHSIYYRYPEEFAGRNVVVVGGGASGQDIAGRVAPYVNSVSWLPVPIPRPQSKS